VTDVVLPSLGESVTEGIVTKWLKAVGDHVDRDEPLYEISTDKVDSEMPSPAAGTLLEVIVAEGDTAAVGARLAVIGDGASAPATQATPPATPATPPAPQAPATPEARSTEPAAPVRPGPASAPATPDAPVTSPVVRRILEDAGLEASRVQGTGPGGTVTRRDAEQAVLRRPEVDAVVPPSNVRRRMAEHMAASVAEAPQAFVAIEADASAVARLATLGSTTVDGVTVDPETVVALAAVRALGEFELLNATTSDEGVVVQHSVNLGLVLAVEDGMLVPVIHAAGGLTLRALARRVADLRERTATRQLTTDDLLGATFTIAGAPTGHVVLSVPILIHPQVAILSVGSVRRVVEEDPGAQGGLRAHDRVVLGCAFDHRVVEVTYVARFLERVGELLAGLDIDSER
jgi:pyruvate dehydrogenase E2 component (dihydrolipoamide acetyltransferase)